MTAHGTPDADDARDEDPPGAPRYLPPPPPPPSWGSPSGDQFGFAAPPPGLPPAPPDAGSTDPAEPEPEPDWPESDRTVVDAAPPPPAAFGQPAPYGFAGPPQYGLPPATTPQAPYGGFAPAGPDTAADQQAFTPPPPNPPPPAYGTTPPPAPPYGTTPPPDAPPYGPGAPPAPPYGTAPPPDPPAYGPGAPPAPPYGTAPPPDAPAYGPGAPSAPLYGPAAPDAPPYGIAPPPGPPAYGPGAPSAPLYGPAAPDAPPYGIAPPPDAPAAPPYGIAPPPDAPPFRGAPPDAPPYGIVPPPQAGQPYGLYGPPTHDPTLPQGFRPGGLQQDPPTVVDGALPPPVPFVPQQQPGGFDVPRPPGFDPPPPPDPAFRLQSPPPPPFAMVGGQAELAAAPDRVPERPSLRVPTLSKRVVIGAVAGVAVLGVAAAVTAVVLSGGGKQPPTAGPGARSASGVFAANPAANTSGHDLRLTNVAAVESTVVAVGGEADNIADRAEFLVSTDGGTTFAVAPVTTASGADSAYGDTPKLVAGGPGSWVAIGSRKGGPAIWTSQNGAAWTRQADGVGAPFQAADRIKRLTWTGSGFVAVGDTSAKGDYSDARPVVWLSSANGSHWERLTDLGPSVSGSVSLTEVAGIDGTVLAHAYGSLPGKAAGTVDALWRSTDGGRTWASVSVPQSQGSLGIALAVTQSGFLLGQNIFTGGQRYGVVYRSSDGMQWSKAGEMHLSGFGALIHLSSSTRGVVAEIDASGKVLLARSADGGSWQAAGAIDKPSNRTIAETAATAASTIVVGTDAGSQFDTGLLTVLDSQGNPNAVTLGKIDGATPADLQVNAMAAANGRTMAVGSSGGDAGLWTTTDGNTWTRGSADLTGPGRRHLLAVAAGQQGWLAAGYTGRDNQQPLVLTSSDGSSWQTSDAFQPGSSGHMVPFGAGYGTAGYVLVGEDGSAAAVWHSADLRTWERGTGDLTGGTRWMRDVTAGSFGYVAAGGISDPKATSGQADRPAVWTSTDGKAWSMRQLDLPSGAQWASLHRVLTSGSVLLATGTAGSSSGVFATAYVSADGGKSWQQVPLPGAGADTIEVTAIATPRGFVVSGAAGGLGTEHVVLWTSPDGRAWQQTRPTGTGLSDDGDHRLAALAVIGTRLVAVGQTADHRGEHAIIWQRPLP